MTAQEAKELLKEILMVRSDAYYDYIQNGGEADVGEEAYFDALNTAIDALEKPEIIYCKDCIYGYLRTFMTEIDKKHEYEYMCEAWDVSMPQFGYCCEAKRRKENDQR